MKRDKKNKSKRGLLVYRADRERKKEGDRLNQNLLDMEKGGDSQEGRGNRDLLGEKRGKISDAGAYPAAEPGEGSSSCFGGKREREEGKRLT